MKLSLVSLEFSVLCLFFGIELVEFNFLQFELFFVQFKAFDVISGIWPQFELVDFASGLLLVRCLNDTNSDVFPCGFAGQREKIVHI